MAAISGVYTIYATTYGGSLVFGTNPGATTQGTLERMRIDHTGNVGIGTANPEGMFHVEKATSAHGLARFGTNGTIQLMLEDLDQADATAPYKYLQNSGGTLYFGSATRSAGLPSVYNDQVVILNSGNVGISTTAPGSLLSNTNVTDGNVTANGLTWLTANTDNYVAYLKTAKYGLHVKTTDATIASMPFVVTNSSSALFNVNGNGNVGINNTSPSAKLQITNGSVLFNGTTGSTPVSGGGTRMMWIPDKGAFRAGGVYDIQWDNTYIGTNSFATGWNTIASGAGSFASGTYSNASADYSTAFGFNTYTSGVLSTAFGYYTTAQSYGSLVIGAYNLISGSATSWIATDPLFVIANGTSSVARSNAVTVLKNGKVGIGTINPAYPLDVNGTIRANEVKVCVGTCDFVFDKDYNLMSIDSLNAYVTQNHHLPGIASAKEMEAEGHISLGQLDSQLLQKVEELTLYIVQQQQAMADMKKQIEELKKK